MSAHNPAVIVHALETVAYELRRAGAVLQTSVEDTAREQMRVEEEVHRAQRLAAAAAEAARDDERRVREIESLSQQALTAAHNAISRCNQALGNAESTRQAAQ